MARHFVGKVVVEWLEHAGKDRDMRLLEAFGFVDESGLNWDVPAAVVVNGASIPQIFWTNFGPPFVGDYRRASVVHDHYCVTKERPWQDVYRMFHEVCLAGGVSRLKAKAMYLAVRTFGPRWTKLGGMMTLPDGSSLPAGSAIEMRPEMSGDDFQNLMKWIEENDPSLDDIDDRSDQAVEVMPMLPGFDPDANPAGS